MADPSLRTGEETPDPATTIDPTPLEPAGVGPFGVSDGQRYRLLEEIARGGMGVIYRAVDASLGREVAVKVLHEKFAPASGGASGAASGAARRFADEARIAAQLQHPAIPPVHDVGTLADGRPFMAMKLIKGDTLDRQLASRPNPAQEGGRFIAVFEQVCQALAYAHAHQVIHRDLKPSNIMVGAFGEVQVMDWGLSKVLTNRERPQPEGDPQATAGVTQVGALRDSDGTFTQAGSVLGTPAYMPPEQAVGAVEQVDARSDVFGLGGILCAILTGRAPFVASSGEATRQMAALGQLADAFARLDACGADPDLAALCRRCLSRDQQDRPADASAVARAVADLRAAADDRARRAELDRVKAEGELAMAEARAAERRKRRRLRTGAAAALSAVIVAGLLAVLVVQRRANDDLAVKNRELDDEQAKVQARFELAQKAIETFHTGVSEDLLLKQKNFKELRTKLLKEAASFYAQLEKLLESQTDFRSRRAVAASYFQLAEVTEKIGAQPDALALHQKALALRRELAAAPDADADARLDVARSLIAVGLLQEDTGDRPAALTRFQEAQTIAEQLVAEAPTTAAREVQATAYHQVAHALENMNQPDQGLAGYRQALAIRQQLAAGHPATTHYQDKLASTHNNIGVIYHRSGKLEQALASYKDALAIRQKLADANPDASRFRANLAMNVSNIGVVLRQMSKPKDALESFRQARGIFRKLADANPAVTFYQSALAQVTGLMAGIQADDNDWEPALGYYAEALAAYRKLADADPSVTSYQMGVARTNNNIASAYTDHKRYSEALPYVDAALGVYQKLSHDHPDNTDAINGLGFSYLNRGEVHHHTGRPADAARDLRQAVQLWGKLKTMYVETRFERGRAMAILVGLGSNPKSGVTAAEAAEFADQAVAALQDAVRAGLRQTEGLANADFDPLRGRADFQKLLAGLPKNGGR